MVASSYPSLTHLYDTIAEQSESGVYTVKRIVSVLSKLCHHQLDAARGVQRIIDSEQSKHTGDVASDHARSCVSGWETTLDVYRLTSIHSMQLSNRVLMEVVGPLSDFHTSAVGRLSELAKEKKKAEKEMAQTHSAVQAEYSHCLRLLASIEAKRDEGRNFVTAGQGTPSHKGGGGLLSKLQKKIETVTLSTPAALNEKLQLQAAKYQVTLSPTHWTFLHTLQRALLANRSLRRLTPLPLSLFVLWVCSAPLTQPMSVSLSICSVIFPPSSPHWKCWSASVWAV